MNTYMREQVSSDTFLRVNFEITFKGIHSWFSMAGLDMDEATTFRGLLQPERLNPEMHAKFLRMVVYRHEDVFFQVNRCMSDAAAQSDNPFDDANEPMHQLLRHTMKPRSIDGEQDMLLNLYETIERDRFTERPKYSTLHSMFARK